LYIHSTITETPGVPKAEEMIRLLVEGQEAVVSTARSVFPSADRVNDEATADLLTQRMQVHEDCVDAQKSFGRVKVSRCEDDA